MNLFLGLIFSMFFNNFSEYNHNSDSEILNIESDFSNLGEDSKIENDYVNLNENFEDTNLESELNVIDIETLNSANAGNFYILSKGKTSEFVNLVDGYKITLPENMNKVDMSMPSVRSVFEDEHRRLEIYKEKMGNRITSTSYINYSNKFLNNSSDHYCEYTGYFTESIGNVNIVQWSRSKLSRLENDRNYYALVDVSKNGYVYTFLFKSDIPFYECGGYMDIVNSFSICSGNAVPYLYKFKKVENDNWNEETKELYNNWFVYNNSVVWGIYQPDALLYNMQPLYDIEDNIGVKFSPVVLYSEVMKNYNPYDVGIPLKLAYKEGRVVELTLQTIYNEDGNMVYDILNGEYDEFLNAYAKDVADFGHPVLFRFCNEMNGDWCQYSSYHTSRDTEIFKELYRYVYGIFENNGAKNVIWVWNPNEKSFPNFKWNSELLYYPGDEYVDVIGITGYNNGTYYSDETWRSFTDIYEPLYNKVVNYTDKPLMITEFSCSSYGGDKVSWVLDMFNNIGKYSNIKVAVWWSGFDLDSFGNVSRAYYIDDIQGVVDIFKRSIGSES